MPPDKFTKRELIKTFLYGDLGHIDPKYADAVAVIKGDQFAGSFLSFEFNDALLTSIGYITQLFRPTVEEALTHLVSHATKRAAGQA